MRQAITRSLLCASVILAVCVASTAAEVASRLHPQLRALLGDESEAAIPQSLGAMDLGVSSDFQIVVSTTGITRIGVLAKLAEGVSEIELGGVPQLGAVGDIISLAVTVAELRELAADPNVLYVEPSWRTEPKLDQSLAVVHADDVHVGSDAVFGEDVVIGIVDTGIDYGHLDFRVDRNDDGFEEGSRIYGIFDQTKGLLGAEYTRSEIESDIAMGLGGNQGSVRTLDRDGHGTHVASIAAGDGSASEYGFVGVAPKATIVAVKTTFFTADILAAVEYVFDQADALGRPAVVNLSLGGHEGPHDGTSLFEQGLDELADRPGRAIVVSAGNEGDLPIHTSGTLSGNAASFVAVPEDWELEIGIWYPGTSQFTIAVTPPGETAIVVPTGTETGYVLTSAGTVYVDNAAGGVNPSNGDREVFIRLANAQSGDRWTIGVSDSGGGGRFDAWVTTVSGSFEDGDSTSTIDEPGNADQVITVGSFNSKATWPSLAGNQDFSGEYPLDALSGFSSRGPTRDGRMKPEVTAPGAWICAAGSSDAATFDYLAHPDGEHVMELGTSMAAPHVSGAIALLFELDPSLTVDDLRAVLTEEASTDGATGSVPSVRWGWGKLDVASTVAAVKESVPTDPTEPPDVPEVSLEANPVSSVATFLFEVPEEARSATLRVYTVAGSLVFETAVSVSAGEYSWNLRSDRGETLATGLYLYVLVTDAGISEVGRLVIAR